MRYLIFSDVHSNLEALKKFLKYSEKLEFDYYVFLGDLVGYGPNPNEVVDKIRKLKDIYMIRGNHDKVVAGYEGLEFFNPVAAKSANWTTKKINPENKKFIASLKKGPMIINQEITIFHGAIFDEDYYILNPFDAAVVIKATPTKISFFGHTHVPIIYRLKDESFEIIVPEVKRAKTKIKLREDSHYLINPGSIGQPRDGNPKLSFMLFDSSKLEIEYFRLKYPYEKTQSKIYKYKLPGFLAERLEKGE